MDHSVELDILAMECQQRTKAAKVMFCPGNHGMTWWNNREVQCRFPARDEVVLDDPSAVCLSPFFGKSMGKPWENHGKTIGTPWKNYGKTMGKWWKMVNVPFWGFVSYHLKKELLEIRSPNSWVIFNWDIYQPLFWWLTEAWCWICRHGQQVPSPQ